jgi:putative membrane protein
VAGFVFLATVGCSNSTLSSNSGSADRNTAADRSAPAPAKANLSLADKDFAVIAAQGGMAEVALGNLAQQQGSSPKVKDFGKKLADEHSKANDELTQIASREGITLPSGLDMKQQQTVERFSKLSGAQFDREFLKDVVHDQTEDIEEFKKEVSQGTDPALRDFASKTVSVLHDHLDMALNAQKSVK